MLRFLLAWLVSVPLAAQQSLEVRVADEGGRSIAGATVLRTQSWRGKDSPELLLSRHQFPLGDVVDRAATDASGICRLPLPPAATYGFMPPRSALFVRAPGLRVACLAFDTDDLPPGPAIDVRLSKTVRPDPIRLRLPDGAPAAGLAVRAIGVLHGEGIALLPDDLIEATRTEADGEVVFRTLRDVGTLEVQHPTLGRQVVTRAWDLGLDGVRLREASPLTVRATGENAAALRGVRLRVWTQPPRVGRNAAPPAERQVLGYAEGVFDAAGQIQLGPLAHGSLVFDPLVADDATVVPEARWDLVHEAGADVELPVQTPRTVRGHVLDRDTKQGVAGVVIRATLGGSVRSVTTAADGTFAIGVWGASRLGMVRVPSRYRDVPFSFGEVVPAGVDELAPFELVSGRVLTGRVLTESGEPVAGAAVSCKWKEKQQPFGERSGSRHTITGTDGRFRLEGVNPDVTAEIEARTKDAKTEPVAATDGDHVLRLAPAAALVLSGRVTGTRGAPIVGAAVTIEEQTVPTGQAVGGAKTRAVEVVATDAAGQWSLAVPLGPDYRVHVAAGGFAESGSAWHRSEPGRLAIDIELRPLVTLRGRVSGAGKPVAGATVRCPARGTSARTDADGAFALEGMPEGPALVVVVHEGTHHARVLADGVTLDLAAPPPRRSAPQLDLDVRLELARQAIEPSLAELEKSGALDKDLRLWELLASIDPARTLARLETKGLAVPWYDDAVRRSLAAAVATGSAAEALAVCETLREAERRALQLEGIAGERTGPEARRLLFEALLSARRIAKPDMRLCVLARIGEGFLEQGDPQTALRVFEEATPLVAGLPNKEWPGYARACFATETAYLDLDRSLSIVGEMSENERDRHHANIAHEIAAQDPEAAERVLDRLSEWSFDRATARVCARMATKDLQRAQRLVAKVGDPALRAYATAAMAHEVRSPELLATALAALDAAPGRASPAIAAAAMLELVASVAPDRLPDAIGRVVALREARSTDPGQSWRRALLDDATIAAWLALYDLDLARAVLEEAIASRAYLLTDRNLYDPAAFFNALALVDARLAVATTGEMQPDHPQKSFPLQGRMRQTVALTLACRTREQMLKRVRQRASLPEMEEDQ